MRKIVALLFLLALAVAVWLGARAFIHRGEIKVTVVMRDAKGLRRGDPVMENGRRVGTVLRNERVDERDAVTVRLFRDSRRAIVTDSLFSVEHNNLVVTNTFAVGSPVADGALIEAKEDGVARFLAKHGQKIAPYVETLKKKADAALDRFSPEATQRKLDEWKASVPTWKKEGKETFNRRLQEARREIDRMADELERTNRAEEARRLRERFDRWWKEVTE